MTKHRTKRLLIFSLVLSAIILKWIFFGSPVFKYFAENTVNKYIRQNYENCYIYGDIEYHVFGLFSPQVAVVKSNTDPDFCINVYTDVTGLFINEKARNF